MSLPETMTAMVLTGHGGPEMLDLRTGYPAPRPRPGEVLVQVAACGLNNTDVNTRVGWYAGSVTSATGDGLDGPAAEEPGGWGGAISFPRVQGADACGRVVAIGDAGDAALLGQRVLIDPWILDPDAPDRFEGARYLGSEVDGGFAQYTVVPTVNAHPIDSPLTDAELATFPCAATTAENLLTRADVRAGETVVVTGASGGVGTSAVQLARARGAIPIGIAGATKADAVLATGAASVVDRASADLGAAVVAAAGRPDVDVVVDVVGGESFGPLIALLRAGGRYATAGAIAGPVVELDLRTLYLHDLRFEGATVCPPGTMAKVVAAIENGDLRPQLAATYPLADLGAAQAAFMAKAHVGNIVVDIPTP